MFASGYAKRMLESQYDKIVETDFGQKLQGLDKTFRYGIEAGLHALGAVIEQSLPEDKPAVMFIKQILEDAPAEISKRLLADVRGNLRSAAQNSKGQEEKTALLSLLELDDAALKELLRWFGGMEYAERSRAISVVGGMAASESGCPGRC